MRIMKLKIITIPNPILKEKSKKISRIDNSVKKLAADMEDTIKGYGDAKESGVALAAIQVGVPIRMTVVKKDKEYLTLVNPEIVKYSKEEVEDIEGCMSVPRKYGKVRRYQAVKVKALGLDGKKIEIKAEDFLARVLQHEIDHMDGILFIEKIIDNNIYTLDSSGKLIKNDEPLLL